MKNIELKELELTNYRNIEFAKYEFNGNSKIIGENRIGKTNTLEAIYWLLTDKLLDGSSDVAAIKPLKDTSLEVRVKATFIIDGKEITLEKQFKERWVKTRGTTNIEFKGHDLTCVHNGVKQSTVKEYNQLVAEDFGFEQDSSTKVNFLQMLVNPFYLGNMGEGDDWKELRSFIIKLVGDVSDDDVAKTKPEFALIKQDLDNVGGRVDQLKKKITTNIDSLKTSIASDEAQISMLEQTPNPTDEEVAIAKKGVEEHEDKIATLKSNKGIDVASMDIASKIASKKIEVSKLENADLLKANNDPTKKELTKKLAELRAKQSSFIGVKTTSSQIIKDLEFDIEDKKAEVENSKKRRFELIEQLKGIDKSIANPVVDLECPTCHRKYDDADLEESKRILLETLNKDKEDLISKGKANKQVCEIAEKEVERLTKELEKENAAFNKVVKDLEDVSKEIDEVENKITSTNVVITPNPQIEVLKKEIVKLEEDLRNSRENFAKGIQDTQQLIYDEEQAMIPFKKVISDREYHNRQMETLVGVRNAKQQHSTDLANAEQMKEVLNQFIYTKLRMLDDNVSKVFGKIRFQLIRENINGGFDTVCKPYIFDTVKEESTTTTWKSGSKSERVATGIAIVEKVKVSLNLPNLPYLFDEGGEISNETFATRIKTNSQIICVNVVDNIQSPIVKSF